MFKRLLKLPLIGKDSIFLFGPRGTGKTSWTKENMTNYLYLDLLRYDLYTRFSVNPGALEEEIPQAYKGWVIIDEVQRIPELLNEVHRLIEDKKIRFLLTGSSARTLRKKGVNLLAGRALRYQMHPLTIQELGDAFDLESILQFGLLPKTINNKQAKKYLETYVQTYLREEVMTEGLTRNLLGFSRFLEAASFSQGQVLNYTEIARELSLNRFTVAGYFTILEDLLLATQIPVFSTRAKRKLIAHNKFYFFDVGVYKTLRPAFAVDTQQELDGAALETLFLQSARAINDYLELDYKIYYWRTMSGNEVDFVLYGPHGLHAFEIKHASTITPKSLVGLKSFGEDYPEAQLHILYTGKRTLYLDAITAHPFTKALNDLPKILHGKKRLSNQSADKYKETKADQDKSRKRSNRLQRFSRKAMAHNTH